MQRFIHVSLALILLSPFTVLTSKAQSGNVSGTASGGTTLTLTQCQEQARSNYPLIQQYGLIDRSESYTLANAEKGYLPQLTVTGKATYQSEVTKLPISLPGITVKGLSKDQYQALAEVNQVVWDGGAIRSQKSLSKTQAEVKRKTLEQELYTLNDRVNQLFFGILLQQAQLQQIALKQEELQRNYDQVKACLQGGIAEESDLEAIEVEKLSTTQKQIELEATGKAYCEMLSLLTGKKGIQPNELEKPKSLLPDVSLENNRPELALFQAQSQALEVQKLAVKSKIAPKLGLFVQGGYGRPGLNMLKNEFTPYYLGGIRMSWNLGNLYTQRNELRELSVQQENIGVLRENFLFNTQLQVAQQRNEIEKSRRLATDDDHIIELRARLLKASEAKVAGGTLTVTEMLRQLTALDLARQNKVTHEIQLLWSQYNQNYLTNNTPSHE